MAVATISLPLGANDSEKSRRKSRRADIDWPQTRKLIRILGFAPTADLLQRQENTIDDLLSQAKKALASKTAHPALDPAFAAGRWLRPSPGWIRQ